VVRNRKEKLRLGVVHLHHLREHYALSMGMIHALSMATRRALNMATRRVPNMATRRVPNMVLRHVFNMVLRRVFSMGMIHALSIATRRVPSMALRRVFNMATRRVPSMALRCAPNIAMTLVQVQPHMRQDSVLPRLRRIVWLAIHIHNDHPETQGHAMGVIIQRDSAILVGIMPPLVEQGHRALLRPCNVLVVSAMAMRLSNNVQQM